MKGLLLDYGGVMTSPIGRSFDDFCANEDIAVDAFRAVMSGAARTPDSPFAKVERGEITEEQFDAIVAGLLGDACGHPIAPEGLKRRMFAAVRPDDAMHAAVRRARAGGIHTVLLSNSWGGRDYPLDELRPLFDALVISGEVGMRKPDVDIYLFAADKAGVAPDECVFVDDFQVNVDGAEAVGMTGILQRETQATLQRLEELLELPLR